MPSTCPFKQNDSPGPTSPPVQSPIFDLNNPDAKLKMRQEMDRISQRQKHIFKETFPVVFKDYRRNGLVLFAKYFSEFPHYKNIWPQFRTLQDSALLASNELANHCSVYMAGLKEIVEVMDDEEKLTYFMARIARSHVKWNINKYHITNMLEGVDAVLKRSFEEKLTDEIVNAYHTLYDVIGNLLDIQKKRRRSWIEKKKTHAMFCDATGIHHSLNCVVRRYGSRNGNGDCRRNDG
ncbi:hypothetical protein L3Y34_003144 [Caenorhabditis briggsae]|uniref:Globin domain-containing protein n=1 Tax=Caenorhabditis briggsae TaxID=6238 RepID=A0AAE9AF94_CAEBR|nr:hypothetical protein L3Y34_003144 [Caenorhabditis briggsae]